MCQFLSSAKQKQLATIKCLIVLVIILFSMSKKGLGDHDKATVTGNIWLSSRQETSLCTYQWEILQMGLLKWKTHHSIAELQDCIKKRMMSTYNYGSLLLDCGYNRVAISSSDRHDIPAMTDSVNLKPKQNKASSSFLGSLSYFYKIICNSDKMVPYPLETEL